MQRMQCLWQMQLGALTSPDGSNYWRRFARPAAESIDTLKGAHKEVIAVII